MDFLAPLGFALAFGFVGSVPLTGPIALLVLSRSVERRFRSAVRIGLGAAVAEGIYAGCAFWGFRTLVGSTRLSRLSDGLSAVVLVGLGLYFLRWRFREHDAVRATEDGGGWTGFSISILNPTLLVTWSAAVAALSAHHWIPGNRWLAVPFGLGAAVGVGAWEVLFVEGIRRWGVRFEQMLVQRLVRGVALVLIVFGAWSGYRFVRPIQPARAAEAPGGAGRTPPWPRPKGP